MKSGSVWISCSIVIAALGVQLYGVSVDASEPLTVIQSSEKKLFETKAAPTAIPSIERVTYVPELLGNLTSAALREASGLALSTRSDKLLWAHNDSGYGPYLFAFNKKGKHLGRFYLESAASGDWEDMAAFKWREQSWLLIADTGDNSSRKTHYTLYLVAEPKVLSGRTSGMVQRTRGVRRARFTLPSGPADTEAVAVDTVEERVYLITKRQRPAQVFTLPLAAFDDEKSNHIARFETKLYPLPAPTFQEIIRQPELGIAFAQPNAMDFAPDRSFAVVHTYGYSYRFSRKASDSWAQAFAAPPQQFNVPLMKQAEAVAVGKDSRSLYYTSEGKFPPLYRLVPASHTKP